LVLRKSTIARLLLQGPPEHRSVITGVVIKEHGKVEALRSMPYVTDESCSTTPRSPWGGWCCSVQPIALDIAQSGYPGTEPSDFSAVRANRCYERQRRLGAREQIWFEARQLGIAFGLAFMLAPFAPRPLSLRQFVHCLAQKHRPGSIPNGVVVARCCTHRLISSMQDY
jgi:hypothetical protein